MSSKTGDGESVRVALRIRPLVESEISRGCVKCLETTPGEQQVAIRDLAFTFNHVFPPEVSQAEFYTTAVKGLVDRLFKGYNVTILAYGQTGSGKTHSMGTAYSGGSGEEMGVIPRAIRDIFNDIQKLQNDFEFRVQVSFMELYQEQLFDLLSHRVRDQSVVDIREDCNKGIVIPGLTEIEVSNATDTVECLIRGSSRRAVGATAMNSQSSRSHAIFTIYIQQQKLQDENSMITSKFHLVDLAGSERANKTKAMGQRFKEGIKINEGLLALGNVISRLGEGNTGYVSYRDSKLTRLLQDSLGGNSMTLMIACVSPADYNLEETISTLRYADRARKIKNKPIINQDPKTAEINRLKALVQQLRLDLLGKGTPTSNGDGDHEPEVVSKLRKEVSRLKEKNSKLMQDIDDYVIETACMNEKVILAEAANDRMNQKLLELKACYEQTVDELTSSGFEFKTAENTLQSMRDKIEEIQHEQKKSADEIQCHEITKDTVSRVPSKYNNLHEDVAFEIIESLTEVDVEAKQEHHVMHQAALTTELHELNQKLSAKQALVVQVAQNSQDMKVVKDGIRENEDVIAKLQKERDELLQQIRNMQTNNASTKLAEERRQKVQLLENEISTLQKKVNQQAKLLKVKEKNDARIVTLNTEIQQMKAAKVKLIRNMRTESENFRAWKKTRERELAKLRDQDRKRANDMARMQHMHGKQQNVLKRKVEEAVACNKRLKEALDRQKNAQARRLQNGQGKADQVKTWVEQELEVFLSTVYAERTLEQLMEDRAMIQRRIDAMRVPLSDGNTMRSEIEKERKQLEEDLSLRTAQIADFQEKIIASDQENKSKTRWDAVQSMVEAKIALRHLFEMAADMRRDSDSHKGRLKDLESQHSETTLKLLNCEEDLKRLREKHCEQRAELEREHEFKISVLLRQLRTDETGQSQATDNELKQRIKIQDAALENMDELQSQLEEYKKLCSELHDQINMLTTRNTSDMSGDKFATPPVKKYKTARVYKQHLEVKSEDLLYESENDDFIDDVERDPDFRNTPLYKRYVKSKNESSRSNRSRASTAIKRNIDGEIRCSCKGSCSNRICGCQKMSMKCNVSCKCVSTVCKNRSDNNSEDENKLSTQISENGLDTTYAKRVTR